MTSRSRTIPLGTPLIFSPITWLRSENSRVGMTDADAMRGGAARFEAFGQHLEYRWIGPGPQDAPTIVFLHEGLGCVGMWRDFPDRVVSATGCGALVYSRMGYGASDPVRGPRPVRFMHDEALEALPAVIEHFELREVNSSSATATASRSRSFTRARDCGPCVRS